MMAIPAGACVVIGAGGHARVVLDILRSGDAPVPCVLLDSDASRWGTAMMGVAVIGGDELLPALAQQGARRFTMGLAAVGTPAARIRLFETAVALGLEPVNVIHSRAVCSQWARTGPGLQMFAGAVVNAGAILGADVVVNTGAVVEHDCRIGDHAHVAPGACLCGGVNVGSGAYIGAGAVVRQGIAIGEGALVGAGAVVVRNVAPHTRVVGCPSRPLESRRKDA